MKYSVVHKVYRNKFDYYYITMIKFDPTCISLIKKKMPISSDQIKFVCKRSFENPIFLSSPPINLYRVSSVKKTRKQFK